MNKLGNKTITQYNAVISRCKELFVKKASDYGTAWRVMRVSSVIDQIFIKAQRISTIDKLGVKKVNEGTELEFMGIINYGIIGLIQLELKENNDTELPVSEVEGLYDQHMEAVRSLMLLKNHDYGEAWRDMRVSSFTDMILMKIMRIKQIEENEGKTIVSEGIDANFRDIMNYAIFALIKIQERHERQW